jgi:hypothetical protein
MASPEREAVAQLLALYFGRDEDDDATLDCLGVAHRGAKVNRYAVAHTLAWTHVLSGQSGPQGLGFGSASVIAGPVRERRARHGPLAGWRGTGAVGRVSIAPRPQPVSTLLAAESAARRVHEVLPLMGACARALALRGLRLGEQSRRRPTSSPMPAMGLFC